MKEYAMEIPYRGTGKVYYSEKEYQCDLYYSENEGGIVLVVNVLHEKAFGKYLELPLEIPFLCGQLENGFKFTLIGIIRKGMKDYPSYGHTDYTYYAENLFCGVGGNKNSEQRFCRIDFVLSNIVEWGEESVYSLGENSELVYKNESIRKTILECEDYCVYYSVSGSLLPVIKKELLQEDIHLAQSGIISIEYNREVEYRVFNDVFCKLKGLIEIATLSKVAIEKITAFSNDVIYTIGNTDIKQPIDIIGINIKKKKDTKKDSLQFLKWIKLSELISNGSVQLYFYKQEELSPIIELYIEPMYLQGSSTTRVFLNIVQALETYHSRFITNDIDTFKDRIETITKDLSESSKNDITNFLMANSKKFITLESRLADLLMAENKMRFDTGKICYYDFPSVIAHTRNYYIHYDERIKSNYRVLSEEELRIYNRSLYQILEYYILIELGFSVSPDKIREKSINRWGNITEELTILDISRNS